jgi:transaldolase
MNIEEFDTYGATARTLRQFIQASVDLATLIRDFMIPDPDRDTAGFARA